MGPVTIDVVEETRPDLAEYATVAIAFTVREVVEYASTPAGRFALSHRSIARPWVKNYDDDGGPEAWQSRFDLSYWRFFVARANGARVGGAAVVHRAPDIDMLHARRDVALLWDIRVSPEMRGQGVGTALMSAVEGWAATYGAEWLEVETQNINAPACRFYERHGFEVREVNPDAYPTLPHEVQLVWYKRVGR
jgi:GNAT superfamily N-acetyltransferase